MSFCAHGVPCVAYCRWCREGGAPEVRVDLTPAQRAARVAEIEREREERSDEIADDFREDPRDFADRCDHFCDRAIDRYDSRDDGVAS